MEIPLPEIIDRVTILKLKIENSNINNSQFKKELEEYEKALKKFEGKGVEIKQEWIDELYEFNKQLWDLEGPLKKIIGSEDCWGEAEKIGFRELGKVYVKLQLSNKKRVAVKNKIAEETKSGFKDIKIN